MFDETFKEMRQEMARAKELQERSALINTARGLVKTNLELVQTINERSGRAVLTRDPHSNGLFIEYTGVISHEVTALMNRLTLAARQTAAYSVVHCDHALTIWDGPIQVDPSDYADETCRAMIVRAMIVRADQMERARAFSDLLKPLGIWQTCWLPQNAALAHEWAMEHSD
ncbi:MAG: hypothetical protein WCP31_10615 [Chloroflexales bacterium]